MGEWTIRPANEFGPHMRGYYLCEDNDNVAHFKTMTGAREYLSVFKPTLDMKDELIANLEALLAERDSCIQALEAVLAETKDTLFQQSHRGEGEILSALHLLLEDNDTPTAPDYFDVPEVRYADATWWKSEGKATEPIDNAVLDELENTTELVFCKGCNGKYTAKQGHEYCHKCLKAGNDITSDAVEPLDSEPEYGIVDFFGNMTHIKNPITGRAYCGEELGLAVKSVTILRTVCQVCQLHAHASVSDESEDA